MRFPVRASIRVTLVLVVLVAVLPAMAILLFSGYSLRDAMIRGAEDVALRQVQAMAAHHQRVVDNARLLLATLAKAGGVQALDPQSSQHLLDKLLSGNGAYSALALADAHGRIVAMSPADSFGDIRSTDYFRQVRQELRFVMGAYHLVANTRRVVMEFAQPVLDTQGRLTGVLVALFDLNYFGRVFTEAHWPEGSVFTLTDSAGMRLTRFPETEKYTWVPDLPQMIAHMSGPNAEGTFLETGVDGVRRLYSFKQLHFTDAPLQRLMIRIGQPEDLALAEARTALQRNFALMLLAAVLAMLLAWFVGEAMITGGFSRLMAAAKRLGAGDLSTRTGMGHETGEIGQLAAAFDRMAASLQVLDYERRRAEEEVCVLNEDLEDRVTERTAELARANKELSTALENLRQAQSQLVMSEKLAALGELVAGIAHEINTPVGVALSATSTMAEKNRVIQEAFSANQMKRSDLTEYLESTREGVEMSLFNLHRASDLIRSFKMVAADQVSETRRSFNVCSYIGEILLSLRPKLKKTSHRVEVECDGNLVIESYPGAFSQILTNFIVNSLTHAFDPDQAGVIRIQVVVEGGMLCMTYSDDGRGIPPEVQGRIFEPFYTTARAQGSTGLGLHIVFNIVTRTLGGTVACCSAPGHGTTFHVRMPLNRENS